MRAVVLAVLLVGPAVAGCLADVGTETPGAGEPNPASPLMILDEKWGATRELVLFVRADLHRIQAALPPGFVAAGYEDMLGGAVPVSPSSGLVTLSVLETAESTSGREAFSWALLGALIERPHVDGIDLEPVAYEFYYFELYTSSTSLVEMLAPLGYAVTPGTARASPMTDEQDALGTARVEDAHGEVWSFDMVAGGSNAYAGETSRGWHASAEGVVLLDLVIGETQYRIGTQTTCAVRPGTLAEDLAGPDCGAEPARALAADYSGVGAKIRFYPGVQAE